MKNNYNYAILDNDEHFENIYLKRIKFKKIYLKIKI